MRIFVCALLAGAVMLVPTGLARAQSSGGEHRPASTPLAILGEPVGEDARDSGSSAQRGSAADDLALLQKQIETLRGQQKTAAAGPQKDDQTKKRLELQQKQIETLEKMVRLLAKQLQTAGGPAVEKLQGQVASLDARSKQAAQRDKELADAVDNINEQRDVEKRYGPQLPATLKELFLPTETNETPLSIYSTFAVGYSAPQTGPQGFFFGEFSPDFFLKLNDWIFFEGEFSAGSNGSVSLTFASADFFVNDWLTVVLGRFVAPIGWYNERANNPWVNKLPIDAPDTPLLWRQVLPTLSLQGVEARGAHYLADLPIKLEYAAYFSNGLNLPVANPKLNDVANLENMENTFSFVDTQDKALGGRVGFWWPAIGLAGGISGMYNGSYMTGDDAIRLAALDLNYHKGNWDLRAEYGVTSQDTDPILRHNITREGFSAQIAYRCWDCPNRFLQKLEFVYRYGYVDFNGINPARVDPTAYASPIDAPVRRQQHTFGIDYWFSPRLVAQLAYEINDEFNYNYSDNQFIFELAWGW
jgi:hypothetical protein